MLLHLRGILITTILFYVAVTSASGAPNSYPIQVQKGLHYKTVYFADMHNSRAIERLITAKYKRWTDNEKSLVIRALSKIDGLNSGILSKACNGTSLILYRASSIGSAEITNSNKHRRVVQALASSVPGAIVWSDFAFYGTDSVAGLLTHELVHLADIGGQLAFSKDWIEFVQKNNLVKSGLYEQSLEETLAHEFQIHVQSRRNEPLNRIVMPLLVKDNNSPYESTYSAALLLFRAGSYSKAAREFRNAVKLSDAVLAHHYLSLAFYKNSELSEALSECRKTRDLLKKLGVTFPERTSLYNLRLTASILIELGQYEEASEVVNTIRSICPTDSSISVLTDKIKKKVGRANGQAKF